MGEQVVRIYVTSLAATRSGLELAGIRWSAPDSQIVSELLNPAGGHI